MKVNVIYRAHYYNIYTGSEGEGERDTLDKLKRKWTVCLESDWPPAATNE